MLVLLSLILHYRVIEFAAEFLSSVLGCQIFVLCVFMLKLCFTFFKAGFEVCVSDADVASFAYFFNFFAEVVNSDL